MGAWIETAFKAGCSPDLLLSRPTWARGLKLTYSHLRKSRGLVAPHVGAWIETCLAYIFLLGLILVAPHVGAWIETVMLSSSERRPLSRPTWARGLKQQE